MGSRWWNRHLHDRSGPPLVDIMYHSEVEYNIDTLINLPSPALAKGARTRMQMLQMLGRHSDPPHQRSVIAC